MENTVLSISHLTKYLGSKLILNDISVEVKSGEIFGFIGPNGSGKTTTIKVMLGLLHLEEGEISICGHNIRTDFREAMGCIGGIIENPEMYKYLTGRENLMQYLRMYDSLPESRIDEVAAIVGLSDRINDKVGKYSLGMKQRLGLAQAILNRPRLLVLDEPTNGLDPAGIKELRDILKELSHNEGTSVFISSHQLAELDLMCDRFAVINRGNIVAVRSMDEVRTHSRNGVEEFTFETVVPAVNAATLVLQRLGNAFTVQDGMFSVTTVSGDKGHGISDTVRELVMAGVPILSAVPVRHSLEEAFLEITGGNMNIAAPGTAPVPHNPSEVPAAQVKNPFAVPTAEPRRDAAAQNNEGGEAL